MFKISQYVENICNARCITIGKVEYTNYTKETSLMRRKLKLQGLIETANVSVMNKFKADLIMNIYDKQKKELLERAIRAVRYKLGNRFKS